MNNQYDDNSISQLKGAERVRLRPEALLGSNGIDGAKHTVNEIFANSTDEVLAGFGKKLEVMVYEDESISVRDYGRGVPLGWNSKENNWNYYLIYEELYAGGKYADKQEILRQVEENNGWADFKIQDYPYLIAIGLNGLGAAATQCTSEFFEVTSYRNGTASYMKYKAGTHVLDELKVFETTEPDGTFSHWKPDDRVFKETHIPAKWLEKKCASLSYLVGIEVTLNYKGKVTVYEPKTLEEVMLENAKNCLALHNFTHVVDSEGDICICDATVALGSEGKSNEYYLNISEMRGGVHSASFNMALSDFFARISKERGVKIKESDYAGKFSVLVSTLANKMSLRGQTKDSADDAYIYNCLYTCIYNALVEEHQKGTEWVEEIVEDVVSAAQTRIAVAEMNKNLREVEKATKRHKPSEKFIPCRYYKDGNHVEEIEVFIVEGDSAGNSALLARDSLFQCIMKIRGKSLNLYKASIEKMLANNEIKDISSALGCGIDLGLEEYDSFDITKLKIGRVYFLTDADIDGKHIQMLLFLIFFKLFPQLLYEGRVFICQTPLYRLDLKNDEVIYCMSEKERNAKIQEIGSHNIRSESRFKGLGEMNPDVLWETTMNPANRKTISLKIDKNDTDIYDVLEVLFGKSTERRKREILGTMMDTDYDEIMGCIDDMCKVINGMDLSEIEEEVVEY